MQLGENKDNILVEVIANHLRDSNVAIPAMDHQQTLQILKLTDSIVSRAHSLSAFLTSNTHADVRL